jgi:hypothetical protein
MRLSLKYQVRNLSNVLTDIPEGQALEQAIKRGDCHEGKQV